MPLDTDYNGSVWGYTNGMDTLSQGDQARAQRGGVLSLGYTAADIPTWNDAQGLVAENEPYLRQMGYSGPLFGYDFEGGQTVSPDFVQWANENGIQAGKSQPYGGQGGGQSAYAWSLFDQNTGQPVGQQQRVANNHAGDLVGMLSVVAAPLAGPLAGAYGGGLAGAAASGATIGGALGGAGTIGTDKNFFDGLLSGALKGGATGAIGGAFGSGAGQYDVGSALGLSDPSLVKLANSAAGTIGKSLVTGSNPTTGLLGNALAAGSTALGLDGNSGFGGNFNANDLTPDAFDSTAYDPNALGSTSPGGDMNYFDLLSSSSSPYTDMLTNGTLDQGDQYTDMFGNTDMFGGAYGQIAQGSQLPSYWTGDLGTIMNNLTGAEADGAPSGGAGGLANLVKGFLGSASSAVGGGKNLAGLLGGLFGAASGGGTDTSTKQFRTDPRMDQYLYGSGYGDPNSLLGAAQKQYQANPTGINSTMQQGLDMSKAALTDPAYAQGYQSIRNAGSGLLNMQAAANPFTNGQNGVVQPQTGLLPAGDRAKNLMFQGRGLLSA